MDNLSIQIQKIVTVTNPLGLHMRPANMLSRTAAQFECLIEIAKDGQAIDGKSIMGILTLGAQQGTQLHLRAVGPDAQQAIDRIVELFENGFDESEPAPSHSG